MTDTDRSARCKKRKTSDDKPVVADITVVEEDASHCNYVIPRVNDHISTCEFDCVVRLLTTYELPLVGAPLRDLVPKNESISDDQAAAWMKFVNLIGRVCNSDGTLDVDDDYDASLASVFEFRSTNTSRCTHTHTPVFRYTGTGFY